MFSELHEISDELRTESLIRLRHLQTRAQPVPHILGATSSIIRTVRDMSPAMPTSAAASRDDGSLRRDLDNMESQVKSFERNAQYLLDRLESTAQMFTDGLALKAQKAAQQQNNHLYELATLSQEQNEALRQDSATIRVITVATLVFLPSTFVSVSGSRLPACV